MSNVCSELLLQYALPRLSLGRVKIKRVIKADMAELADALVSGTSEGNFMQVQVLLSA